MADAYSRMSDTVAALSVHQGSGLTNAMTGITEAAKSRTPMLVLAAEATQPLSNFYVDQMALAAAVGAEADARRRPPETAVADAAAAFWTARHERRTVVVNLPLDVQAAEVPAGAEELPPAAGRAAAAATPTASPGSPPRSRGAGGRCSSPGAAPGAPAAGRRWRRSPRQRRAAGHRAPWRTGCSTATRGRSGSPAASPRRCRGADPRRRPDRRVGLRR